MSHIERRIQSRSDGSTGSVSWRARYRTPDKREVSRTFPTKKAAELWLAGEVSRMADGRWVDPTAGRITFADWADEYQTRAGTRRPTTVATRPGRIRTGRHWRREG